MDDLQGPVAMTDRLGRSVTKPMTLTMTENSPARRATDAIRTSERSWKDRPNPQPVWPGVWVQIGCAIRRRGLRPQLLRHARQEQGM